MDANEPVVVYTTTNPGEAEFVKNLLEGAGIKCDLSGETQGGLSGILDMRVLVRAWDEERAREVLTSHAHRHQFEAHPRKPREA